MERQIESRRRRRPALLYSVPFGRPRAYTDRRNRRDTIIAIRHPLSILCATLVAAAACERHSEDIGGENATTEAEPIAGMYEVGGTTIETGSGRKREISGTVILAEDGESYTATFHLTTVFEGGEGVLPAEVIGKGSGTIDGRSLRGSAETQLVISSIPGIDPAFAFIPRTTTTRIVSRSVTSIARDGTVEITIENQPAAGEVYQPTRTTLHGRRVGASGIGGDADPPPVETEPPGSDG